MGRCCRKSDGHYPKPFDNGLGPFNVIFGLCLAFIALFFILVIEMALKSL